MGSRSFPFTQEIADIICDRLMDGESLKSICSEPQMPSRVTVCKWLNLIPDFANNYARAREVQADALFDDTIHIANTPQLGVKTITKPTGVEIIEGDMIEHRKLQIETRKWVAGKLRPKKYGDAVGKDPEASNTGTERIIRVIGGFPEAFESKE
jgi:hypothetical protein